MAQIAGPAGVGRKRRSVRLRLGFVMRAAARGSPQIDGAPSDW